MNQITIVSACEVDGEGFRQRLLGRGIRDCILVLSSEGISLGLLHKERSSRTFVEDEILGREAALDIDSGRVVYEKGGTVASNPILRRERGCKIHANIDSNGIWGEAQGTPEIGNLKGRFPANLILMHDSECEKFGTKRVKNQGGKFRSNEFKKNPYSGGYKERPNTHFYFGDDGYEETDNWECLPTCPVGLLDAQSGVSTSGAMKIKVEAYHGESITGFLRGFSGPSNQHGDSGGASRFFKQVTSQEELQSYFDSMVRR